LPTISQARNKGERNPLQKFSLPLENVLDIVQNFGPLSQSSLHPGVPSWLRACSCYRAEVGKLRLARRMPLANMFCVALLAE